MKIADKSAPPTTPEGSDRYLIDGGIPENKSKAFSPQAKENYDLIDWSRKPDPVPEPQRPQPAQKTPPSPKEVRMRRS